MVVCESEVHHGADFDFSVDSDRLVLDGVETEDSSLWEVDDGSSEHGAEDTTVGDGESAASHVFDGKLVVASLSKSAYVSFSYILLIMLTFLPRSAIAFSMPTMSKLSAFRTTGVTRPFSVATATLMST